MKNLKGLLLGLFILGLYAFLVIPKLLKKSRDLKANGEVTYASVLCYRNINYAAVTNSVCLTYIVNDTIYVRIKNGSRPKKLTVGSVYKVFYDRTTPINSTIEYDLPVDTSFIIEPIIQQLPVVRSPSETCLC